MAVKPFSKEQLNFFKFTTLVFDEFPKVLRQICITMWDSKVAILACMKVCSDYFSVRPENDVKIHSDCLDHCNELFFLLL